MSEKYAVINKSIKKIILQSDTGATRNYIRGQDTTILKNPGPTNIGPRVRLPNSYIIQPTLFAHLPVPTLLSAAKQVMHIQT